MRRPGSGSGAHRLPAHLAASAGRVELLLEVVELLRVVRVGRGGPHERRVLEAVALAHRRRQRLTRVRRTQTHRAALGPAHEHLRVRVRVRVRIRALREHAVRTRAGGSRTWAAVRAGAGAGPGAAETHLWHADHAVGRPHGPAHHGQHAAGDAHHLQRVRRHRPIHVALHGPVVGEVLQALRGHLGVHGAHRGGEPLQEVQTGRASGARRAAHLRLGGQVLDRVRGARLDLHVRPVVGVGPGPGRAAHHARDRHVVRKGTLEFRRQGPDGAHGRVRVEPVSVPVPVSVSVAVSVAVTVAVAVGVAVSVRRPLHRHAHHAAHALVHVGHSVAAGHVHHVHRRRAEVHHARPPLAALPV